MLGKIVDAVEKFRKIESFISSVTSSAWTVVRDETEANERAGLYLQAFANGVDKSLDEYRKTIVDTEKRYLQNPHNPMSTIFVAVYPYSRFMDYLLKMIHDINTQK